MDHAARMQRFDRVDLYPVTCERLSAGRTNLEVLEGLLAGGARIVQLREKTLPDRVLLRMAEDFRARTARAGALLIINDRVDIALAVDADGVHLGQDDLPVAAARRLAPEMILGVSTHSLEQALAAQAEGASYVNIGPLFPTATKQDAPAFLGPEAVTDIAPRLRIPFTVMGGITRKTLAQALRAGARRVALVTAVTQAPDIAAEVRFFRNAIQKATQSP